MAITVRQLSPIIWTMGFEATNLRQVVGHAWTPEPAVGNLRQIVGHAWIADSGPLPLKNGKDALLDLINNNAKVVFSWDTLIAAAPVTDSTIAGRNTKITVTAGPSAQYSGSIDLFYNRIPISSAFTGTVFNFTIPAATTILALIAQINTSFGTFFTTDDLVDGPVAANAPSITLTVADTSYMFTPGDTLSLSAPATVLLMHFESNDGENGLKDEAGHIATAIGGMGVSTTQHRIGTSSFLMGSAGWLKIPFADEFALPNDFTIEFFLYPVGPNSNIGILCSDDIYPTNTQSNNSGGRLHYSSQTTLSRLYIGDDGIFPIVSNQGTIALNVWQHIAIVKSNGVWILFINGVLQTSLSFSIGWIANRGLNIGVSSTPTAALPGAGYLDELRISNVARYTENFTPQLTPFVLD